MKKIFSTQKLYEAMVDGRTVNFTVPAFNFRMLAFDSARALFRAAQKESAGAFIIELARSEMEYTAQPPKEYAKTILSAAKQEKYQGPIFLQGDHFNLRGSEENVSELEKLISQSVKQGFYNIDIDCSALPLLENITATAYLTKFIRGLGKNGITISIGAEIGEIGKMNTTFGELRDFIQGYSSMLSQIGDFKGIIKVSAQTGTVHGVGGDIDWDNLSQLAKEAKDQGLAGIVQHGASTLPDDYFEKFPEFGVCEVHLSTQFQNIIMDSQYFPQALKALMYQWVKENYSGERQNEEIDTQFYEKFRKYAIGPFKKQIQKIPQEDIDKIAGELENQFILFFKSLKVSGTDGLVNQLYGI